MTKILMLFGIPLCCLAYFFVAHDPYGVIWSFAGLLLGIAIFIISEILG